MNYNKSWKINLVNILLGYSLFNTVLAEEVCTNHVRSDFSHLYYSEMESVFYPKSVEAVQEIIKNAQQQGKKISIAGTALSQGGHTLPSQETSFLIHSKFLNRVEIIEEKKIAKVGPGATWKDVQDAAHQVGLAVRVMQASNVFSIGGSISTNVHGWDHKSGSLVETIHSITIVDAKGEVQNLLPGDELFSLVIGGYGMFGVIVEAEIMLIEDVIVQRLGTLIPTDNYVEHFYQTVLTNPNIVLHYGKLSLNPLHLFEDVIAVNYILSDTTYSRPKKLAEEPVNGHWYERLAINALRKYPYLIQFKQTYDNQTFLNSKIMTRNESMLPSVRFAYDSNDKNADMLQEFFLPIDQLTHFLRQLSNIVENYDIHLFNATIRHVKQDRLTALPYAKQDVVAIVLYYNESLDSDNVKKVECFVQDAVDAALIHGGTYYLPYHRFPLIEQFQRAYPEYKVVKDKRNQWDPQHLFSSQFATHYFES